jgi:uncharacterized protein YkwD
VRPHKGGWRVVDEGSSNGTWLGGKPVLAARLKPGDEVEIGETVIRFVADAGASAAPREPRRARAPARKSLPWGLLAVPLVASVAAFLLVRGVDRTSAEESAAANLRYARAEIDHAKLAATQPQRGAALAAARQTVAIRPDSAKAIEALDTEIAGAAAPSPGEDAPEKPAADWRPVLDQFENDRTMSAGERRAKLRDLLERNLDDPDALQALRRTLAVELVSVGDRQRADRERTFEAAGRATNEGRLGQALDLWISWVARTPELTAEDDKDVAQRISAIVDAARAAAQQAADQYETARREGREAAGVAILDAAIERLHGTGFDRWLAARGSGRGTVPGRIPVGKPGIERPADDATTRERNKALQTVAAAEEISRRRRFSEAAAKIEEAAAAVSDKELKGWITTRALELRGEAALLAKLVAQVAADPKGFSPIQIDGKAWRIVGATTEEISVLDKDGRPDPRPIESVPPGAIAQIADKAVLDATDWVPAALLFHDLGEEPAYTKWMLQALAAEETRLAVSEVHARCIAQKLPPNGYVAHPETGRSVVTYDEARAIRNAKQIADLRTKLVLLVDKVETSRQAKQVETVRKAYAKLEHARKFALDLIFDEVKYFYPYRDRMKEYAPVSHEVDERVKLVREAWADTTSAKVRNDSALEKLVGEAEKLSTEIQFYGGDSSDLVNRVDNVRMYVGKDLTVQTFFENERDAELMAYNVKVMKHNPAVKGPTEPEREQVRITNEYRIMFGHRRALRIHPFLVQSARGHSDDMGKLGFFDHFSPVPGKRTPDDRMKLAGYVPAGGSENIHAGSGSPEGAHEGWTHSSGHHRNLLSPGWVEMGTGQSGRFWTQNFGFRLDDDWEGGIPK